MKWLKFAGGLGLFLLIVLAITGYPIYYWGGMVWLQSVLLCTGLFYLLTVVSYILVSHGMQLGWNRWLFYMGLSIAIRFGAALLYFTVIVDQFGPWITAFSFLGAFLLTSAYEVSYFQRNLRPFSGKAEGDADRQNK